MAYVVDNQDKDKTQGTMSVFGQQPQTEQTSTTPTQNQGVSSSVTASTQISQAPTKRQGTGFTNLSKYIQANLPQAQKLAEDVVGKTQEKAQKVTQEAQKAQESFQSALAPEQQRLANAQQTTRQIIESAVPGQALSEDLVSQYNQLTNQQGKFNEYAGPDYAKASLEAQNLQNLGRQAGTTAGRFQLLEQTLGGGQPYTSGQKALDELILAGSKPASERIISGTREITKELPKTISSQQEATRQALLNLRQQASQAKEAATGELGTISKELQTGLEERAADTTGREAALKSYTDALTSRQLTADQLSKLGLQSGQTLYGIDPTQYLKIAENPTLANLATPEEVARYEAIRQLTGEAPFYSNDKLTELSQELAGTYDPNAITGIKDLQGAIDQGRANYEGERSAKRNELNQSFANVGATQFPEVVPLLEQIASTGKIPAGGEDIAKMFDRNAAFVPGAYEEIQAMGGDPNNSADRILGVARAYAKQRDINESMLSSKYKIGNKLIQI